MKKQLIFSFLWMLFVIPSTYALDLSSEKLTKEMLSLIYEHELDYMRNEIFARKGYVFSNPKYQRYFESFSWYTPAPDNRSVVLTDIEAFNVELLKQQSKKIALAKRNIANYLKKVGNRDIILEDLKFYLEAVKEMSEAIHKIDFCGDRGEYTVGYNNGYSRYSQSITISLDNNSFALSFYDALSENYPTDARLEQMIDDGDAGETYLQGGRRLMEFFFDLNLDWKISYYSSAYT